MIRKRHFKAKYSCDPQPELKYGGNGFKKKLAFHLQFKRI